MPEIKKEFRCRLWLILLATLAFLFGLYAGLAAPTAEVGGTAKFLESIRELAKLYKPYSVSTMVFLLLKNSLTVYLIYLVGVLLAFPSAIMVMLNGFVVGAVGRALANEYGILIAFASLATHGIFEITALIIAGAFGLSIGLHVIRKFSRAPPWIKDRLAETIKRDLATITIACIPLLAIAAFIETYVTPLVSGLY